MSPTARVFSITDLFLKTLELTFPVHLHTAFSFSFFLLLAFTTGSFSVISLRPCLLTLRRLYIVFVSRRAQSTMLGTGNTVVHETDRLKGAYNVDVETDIKGEIIIVLIT